MGLNKLGEKYYCYGEQRVPTLQKQVVWVSHSKRWSLPTLLPLFCFTTAGERSTRPHYCCTSCSLFLLMLLASTPTLSCSTTARSGCAQDGAAAGAEWSGTMPRNVPFSYDRWRSLGAIHHTNALCSMGEAALRMISVQVGWCGGGMGLNHCLDLHWDGRLFRSQKKSFCCLFVMCDSCL